MHKNVRKCNETLNKWCKNKHGASKIMDTFETYHTSAGGEAVSCTCIEEILAGALVDKYVRS
jgi:hypothetical protein